MKSLITLFLLLIVVASSKLLAADIYICTDQQGRSYYSDTRCDAHKSDNTQEFDNQGQIIPPANVTIFSSVLDLFNQSLTLLNRYEPDNQSYQTLYEDLIRIDIAHQRFLSNPVKSRFKSYSPFGADKQRLYIAALSEACRSKGYLSICSAIEGNPWIKQTELDWLMMENPDFYTSSNSEHCEKAEAAYLGGVISEDLKHYFCRVASK